MDKVEGKAARLLDVLMDEYDVVVMNPPYGQTIDWSIIPEADEANKNFYCTFLFRARALLSEDGYVGALTDRTYLLLNSFARFRTSILHTMPILTGLDLGWDILDDANVATIAAVFGTSQSIRQATFIQCLDVTEKEACLQSELAHCGSEKQGASTFLVELSDLEIIPTHPFCYWAPSQIRQAFKEYKKLEPGFGIVRKGLSPGNTPRFVRQHWEVQDSRIGMHWWVPYANGGSFSPYYRDNSSVVLWRNDGEAIKATRPKSVVRSEQLYSKPGLTYGKRHHFLNVQFLEEGHIFSNEGYIIRCKPQYDQTQLAALLNSSLLRFIINLMSGLHKEVTSVKNLPIPEAALAETNSSLQNVQTLYQIKRAWDTGNEICTRFTVPWLLQLAQPPSAPFAQGLGRVLQLLDDNAPQVSLSPPPPVTLSTLLDRARTIEDAADTRLQALQAQIDEAVYDLYEISPADRALVERELGDRPPELVWPQLEGKSDEEKRREHVRRFFSHYARQAVREDKDGIVPLAGCAAREPYLITRVRAQLEAQFGPAVAYQLEQDGAAYLGRPVEEWLQRYFFARFHVRLYKKRPILWHLTSPRRRFAVMVDYHQLTHDTLPKVQTLYLWPQMEEVRTRLAAAGAGQVLIRASVKAIADLEDELADLEETEKRLAQVIDSGYNPDIDAGVKANLLPLQEAGLLPVKRVV